MRNKLSHATHKKNILPRYTLALSAAITINIQKRSFGYWTGIHRWGGNSNDWVWADNTEADYTNWRPGEPSGVRG